VGVANFGRVSENFFLSWEANIFWFIIVFAEEKFALAHKFLLGRYYHLFAAKKCLKPVEQNGECKMSHRFQTFCSFRTLLSL
jgi:hypothetical protein